MSHSLIFFFNIQILEEEKVHNLMTIGEYPLYMVPLDEDVLSFELDLALKVWLNMILFPNQMLAYLHLFKLMMFDFHSINYYLVRIGKLMVTQVHFGTLQKQFTSLRLV